VRVEEHTEEIDGQPIFWRSAPAGDGATPVVYLHGVPDSSDAWLEFLARTGGLAPDLPGFGRSAKRGDFDYSIEGYDRWIERFLDHVGVERFRLVAHDWGAVGLALAQRAPERIERLIVIDAVPFLPGYRWHAIARLWRRRVVGELAMGATTRWGFGLISRRFNARPLPDAVLDRWWSHFDQGTQRAILRLYRSAPSERLEAAGARLGAVDAPALVVWGTRDPFLSTALADAYAERLPHARARHVEGAGHWPWLDVPALVEEVCDFATAAGAP
jgi:pimeloyl-ACP methyl ester carboxylesterase